MIRKITLISILAMSLISCAKFDDVALWNKSMDMDSRLSVLERLCDQLNGDIMSLQVIIETMQQYDYVTSVVPVMQNNVEIGYTIVFSHSTPITIYHGKEGAPGMKGDKGDTYVPVISVKQDNGVYYWTIDGNWMLDDEGNRIKAEGKDGKDGKDGADGKDGKDGADGKDGVDGKDGKDGDDGKDGKNGVNGTNGLNGTDGKNGADGKDGITPQLKIDDNYWFISYDNGSTWNKLGRATGEKGDNGLPGADGNSIFESVDNQSSTEYVVFRLIDGSEFKIPTWSVFEALQRQVNEMNTTIESLQEMVDAINEYDYITSISPLTENGLVIGYTISFAKSSPIVIYNGKNGLTPKIGIKQDLDDNYYWTLNGEFIEVDGQKICAQGKDGINGSDGISGITPKLKIDSGYWWISYNNGIDWEKLDKATGDDGKDAESIKITEDEYNVYFDLPDGTRITISKSGGSRYNPSDYIRFEDIKVKLICVQNWDTNYDGELSYEEAASVTSIGSVFSKNKEISWFNEFKYFTNILELDESAFRECSNLTHIELPENLSTIGNYALAYCPLVSLTIPANVKKMGHGAIVTGNADRMHGGVLFEEGSKLMEIGTLTFSYCGMKEICIPAGVTILPYEAFSSCRYLEKISFEGNSQLSRITVNLGRGPFDGCISLSEIDLSNCINLTVIEDRAFNTLNSLTIFKIGSEVPPTCGDNTFSPSTEAVLYVPKGSIGLYKESTGWSKFKNIEALEDIE